MSDDLIKRSDVLFMIDAFERDFQQSWRVQFRANIDAIPAVKDDLIEELRLCRIADAITLIGEQRKLAKAVEIGNKMAKSIKGNYYIPNVVAEWNAVLTELEGEE